MKNIMLSDNDTGIAEINIENVVKSFQDTRKHNKHNRIVADSFITFSNFGNDPIFTLVDVKNSQICTKIQISHKDATSIIEKCNLIIDEHLPSPFRNTTTWRTEKGCKVVQELLASA